MSRKQRNKNKKNINKIKRLIEADGRFEIIDDEIEFVVHTFFGELQDKKTGKEYFLKIPTFKNEDETHASYRVKRQIGRQDHVERLLEDKPFKFGEYFAIIAELADGSLQDCLEEGSDFPSVNFEKSKEEKAIYLAKHLSKGFKIIHSEGIIHRDVKPSNILLFDENMWALGDLSTSKVADKYTKQILTRTHASAEMYSSFELLKAFSLGKANKIYSEETDIFGLGAMLYQCMDKNKKTIFEQISERNYTNYEEMAQVYSEFVETLEVSEDIKYVLKRMMALQAPREELSAKQLEKFRYTNIDQVIRDLNQVGSGTVGTPIIEKEPEYKKDLDEFKNIYGDFKEVLKKAEHSTSGYQGTIELKTIDDLITTKETFRNKANEEIINNLPERNDLFEEAMDEYAGLVERTELELNQILDKAEEKYNKSSDSDNVDEIKQTLIKVQEVMYVWGKPIGQKKEYSYSDIINKKTDFH